MRRAINSGKWLLFSIVATETDRASAFYKIIFIEHEERHVFEVFREARTESIQEQNFHRGLHPVGDAVTRGSLSARLNQPMVYIVRGQNADSVIQIPLNPSSA